MTNGTCRTPLTSFICKYAKKSNIRNRGSVKINAVNSHTEKIEENTRLLEQNQLKNKHRRIKRMMPRYVYKVHEPPKGRRGPRPNKKNRGNKKLIKIMKRRTKDNPKKYLNFWKNHLHKFARKHTPRRMTTTATTTTTFSTTKIINPLKTTKKETEKNSTIDKLSTRARNSIFTKPHKETIKSFQGAVKDDKHSKKSAEEGNSRLFIYASVVSAVIIVLSASFAAYKFYF